MWDPNAVKNILSRYLYFDQRYIRKAFDLACDDLKDIVSGGQLPMFQLQHVHCQCVDLWKRIFTSILAVHTCYLTRLSVNDPT